MSLSSPYNGSGNQSPLGGPAVFGTQNWGGWNGQQQNTPAPQQGGALTGGGALSPATPQPSAGAVQAPIDVTSGAAQAPQPVMGSAQAPAGVTDGATNMMVNALAQPAPTTPANPAPFAPQNAPVAPQAPANPLPFFAGMAPQAAAPAAQLQNPLGF